jgi:uncharacterized protein (DUF305 family)
MKTRTTLVASVCASIAIAAPAVSQDREMFQLPDQCSGSPVSGMNGSDMHGSMMEQGMDHHMDMSASDAENGMMPEHVRQNMQKMLMTMPAMRQGMMHQDADIAFACGMIAHHQTAIDMAQVVLDHGRDAEMRRLAEEIMDVQADEIEFMTLWLEKASN